jgi:serine/threonine-protein kinase
MGVGPHDKETVGDPKSASGPGARATVVADTIPRQIGQYPVERELGRGGMGVVYLGRDTRLNRPVAIKVLPGEWPVASREVAQGLRT